MKRFTQLTWMVLFLAATLSATLAQSTVTGVVTDANDDSPLIAANIYLEGTTIGTVTNLNGEFVLPVNPGSYVVVASYIGYETMQQEVTVGEGGTPRLTFQLVPQAIMGEEVIVTAMMRGQRAAINTQLNANGIVNAVSEEQIQELPDANAAEALGRLPGISLKRSGGEAQSIVLRGLNEKFSQIQLDGVPFLPPMPVQGGWT